MKILLFIVLGFFSVSVGLFLLFLAAALFLTAWDKWWGVDLTAPKPRPLEVQRVSPASRAILICGNSNCPCWGRQAFLLGYQENALCSGCHQPAYVEPETKEVLGSSPIFREVRVRFDFDSHSHTYRQTALVKDHSIPEGEGSVFILSSPLIKTERRALTVAEVFLGSLHRRSDPYFVDVPLTETILSFDVPREKFAEDCETLRKSLSNSHLVKK